ncbi:MAG: ABC transporter ATP-binding protein [bacterium]
MINLENVSKSYHGEVEVAVLHDLNLFIRGGLVVILGSSGCGKTTLLNLIGGLDFPSKGRIFFEGKEIPYHDPGQLVSYRRNKIGFIFQFYNLLPTLTAVENLEVILDLTVPGKKEKRDRCLYYLQKVGMEDKARRFPYQLSGGEQQRVAIARALVKNPALVLADEPTGNLDEANHEVIMDLIHEMAFDNRTTFMIATHNETVADLADHVIVIRNGRIVENSLDTFNGEGLA